MVIPLEQSEGIFHCLEIWTFFPSNNGNCSMLSKLIAFLVGGGL